jgi:hypothetical protein
MIGFIFLIIFVSIPNLRIWPGVDLGSDTKNDVIAHEHMSLASE